MATKTIQRRWASARLMIRDALDRPVTGGEVDQCRIEARKVARLRHPNIVPVHDVGRECSNCFIVGEWVEGANLAVQIKEGSPDFRKSARIVAEIADALGQAHSAGFVHRDIKPSNILLDPQGRVYLTDFAIAVVEEDLLRDVGAAGTLSSMGPSSEAARGMSTAELPPDHHPTWAWRKHPTRWSLTIPVACIIA